MTDWKYCTGTALIASISRLCCGMTTPQVRRDLRLVAGVRTERHSRRGGDGAVSLGVRDVAGRCRP
jgi:hypothetical protein